MSVFVRLGSQVFREIVAIDIEHQSICVKRGSGAIVTVNLIGPRTKVVLSSSPDPGLHADIRPSTGVVPFTALVTVYVSPVAELGVHSAKIAALDKEKKVALATASLNVIVVNDKLSDVVKKISEYRSLYREKGAQYALLKMLWDWSKTVFTFAELKAIYEIMTERSLSKGTVYDVLRRMLRKGLIVREPGGYMFNPKITLQEAVRVIDVKRAISGKQGALSNRQKVIDAISLDGLRIPTEVMKIIEKASRIAEQDYWRAIDLIAHTVIGVRKTGGWFLWVDNYFIYYENKTGLLHYFKSSALAELLRGFGFREGPMFKHKEHSSEDVIHDLYGSYPNARRLHYLLKQWGWFEYPDHVLILEFYYSTGNILYISVRNLNTDSIIWKHGEKPEQAEKIERVLVIPGEHVDKENEETYFYRPAGLY